jgi:hypothetical protein
MFLLFLLSENHIRCTAATATTGNVLFSNDSAVFFLSSFDVVIDDVSKCFVFVVIHFVFF